MKNQRSKSPQLNELDTVPSTSNRVTSSIPITTSAVSVMQPKRRLRNRSISDGLQKKSQSPVDPSILSVLDEDEITSSFGSMDQFGRLSPGTPPKKLWERQYGNFLRNRNNNNNNRSTESLTSSPQRSEFGLPGLSLPVAQDNAVRGGNFFSSVFRGGAASDPTIAGKARKNSSSDELDGTLRRGADKAHHSPRNTRQHLNLESIQLNTANAAASGNFGCIPDRFSNSPSGRDNSSSIGSSSTQRLTLQPKDLATDRKLPGETEEDFPPFPPLLIPPIRLLKGSKLEQETLSIDKLLHSKFSTSASITGTLSASAATTTKSMSSSTPIESPNSDPNGVQTSAIKKEFTKIRHSSGLDADSAYLGDDPSVSKRNVVFTPKNEQLFLHSELNQQHRRSQTNSSGTNLFSLAPAQEDTVSVKSTRILKPFAGVETWETGRRYLIAPAALAGCPTAIVNRLLRGSCTTPTAVSEEGIVSCDVSNSVFDIVVLGECLLSYITDSPATQWTAAKLVLRQNYLLEYDSGVDVQSSTPRGFAHLEGATTDLHEHFRDALKLNFFGSPCAKADARSLMIRIRQPATTVTTTTTDNSIHRRPEIRMAWQSCLNRAASLTQLSSLYEIDETEVLGKGQYAEVRAARRRGQVRSDGNNINAGVVLPKYDCALKIFNKDKFWRMVVKGRERADTIVREASVHATLLSRCPDNSTFLRIRGFFETASRVVLELELLESTDLFKYVTSKAVLRESEASVILRDILRCLHDMSKCGMAHRDIKPANILICGEHQQSGKSAPAHIKVCDFGMATFVGVDGQVRGRCGTPGYVAPEIFSAGTYGGYGNKVDVFSAGVTLYVMLSGYEPFYGETDDQLKEANKAAVVEFPSEDWSGISSDAVDLVKKMMHPDPVERLDAHQALNHPWISKNISQSMIDADQGSTETFGRSGSCAIS